MCSEEEIDEDPDKIVRRELMFEYLEELRRRKTRI